MPGDFGHQPFNSRLPLHDRWFDVCKDRGLAINTIVTAYSIRQLERLYSEHLPLILNNDMKCGLQ